MEEKSAGIPFSSHSANSYFQIFNAPSSPSEDHATSISRTYSVQLSSTYYEALLYLKSPPDPCRGAIRGLDSGLTDENLLNLYPKVDPFRPLTHARPNRVSSGDIPRGICSFLHKGQKH